MSDEIVEPKPPSRSGSLGTSEPNGEGGRLGTLRRAEPRVGVVAPLAQARVDAPARHQPDALGG